MKTGLTLGKFAPLHRGHQYMIETALKEVDKLILVIYDSPDVTDIPLSTRSEWIRILYPDVEVIESYDGPSEAGNTPEIRKMHEDYLAKLLRGKTITHFYSGEFYGDHISKAFNALDRRIDSDRVHVPVSATKIRMNPFEHREYLDPLVYRSFISNILLLGAPSTGKTTLAGKLATEFCTVWMPEYGREYWDRYQVNRRLTLEQLVEIAEGHIERENEKMCNANRYLFTDTSALTTYLFSLYYHGEALPALKAFAALTKFRYDKVLLCGTDIPYDDTGDRSGNLMRMDFQKRTIDELEAQQVKYTLIEGTLSERIEKVKKILASK